jgi:isopropylmalate/homocitrate/citramalate synthase
MITSKEKEAEFEKIKESITIIKKLKTFDINNIEALFPTFASEYPTLMKAILASYVIF